MTVDIAVYQELMKIGDSVYHSVFIGDKDGVRLCTIIYDGLTYTAICYGYELLHKQISQSVHESMEKACLHICEMLDRWVVDNLRAECNRSYRCASADDSSMLCEMRKGKGISDVNAIQIVPIQNPPSRPKPPLTPIEIAAAEAMPQEEVLMDSTIGKDMPGREWDYSSELEVEIGYNGMTDVNLVAIINTMRKKGYDNLRYTTDESMNVFCKSQEYIGFIYDGMAADGLIDDKDNLNLIERPFGLRNVVIKNKVYVSTYNANGLMRLQGIMYNAGLMVQNGVLYKLVAKDTSREVAPEEGYKIRYAQLDFNYSHDGAISLWSMLGALNKAGLDYVPFSMENNRKAGYFRRICKALVRDGIIKHPSDQELVEPIDGLEAPYVEDKGLHLLQINSVAGIDVINRVLDGNQLNVQDGIKYVLVANDEPAI